MKTDEEFDLKRETDHWTSYLLASIAEGHLANRCLVAVSIN
jgi:hypothetical protein